MTVEPSKRAGPAVETLLYIGGGEAAAAAFDESAHNWTIGDRQARVVIATDGALPADASSDGPAPYLGVAVHGVPNYFLITGPDSAAQKAYIAKCLAYLNRAGGTRIEVRSATQRLYDERSRGRVHSSGHYWRRVARRIPSAFDVSSGAGFGADDDVFDGTATVLVGGVPHRSRVRLAGRIDPIDGHYHWQGTVFDIRVDVRLPQDVRVVIGGRTADARLTERTTQSTLSVVGIGPPPFADHIEVEVPPL